MKKKWLKKAVALVLTACIALAPGEGFNGAESRSAQAAEQEIPSNLKLGTQNDALMLYIDEESTAIAVLVKETGDIWYSNPQGIDADTIASSYHKDLMRSQFSIRYFNQSAQSSEMENYTVLQMDSLRLRTMQMG